MLPGVVASLLSGVLLVTASGGPEPGPRGEYDLKAACLFTFAQFVTWPDTKVADSNETMVLGVIGRDPFGNAFDPVLNRRIHGRILVIKKFKGLSQRPTKDGTDDGQLAQDVAVWRKCHFVFICSSEEKEVGRILKSLEGFNVLTVGETEGFVGSGGMIGFIPGAETAAFEVNLDAARKEKLTISASVLRLAKKVVRDAASEKRDKGS